MGFLCYYLKAVFRRITKMIHFKIRFPHPLNLIIFSIYRIQEIIMRKKTSKTEYCQLSLPEPESVCIILSTAQSPGMHVFKWNEWNQLIHIGTCPGSFLIHIWQLWLFVFLWEFQELSQKWKWLLLRILATKWPLYPGQAEA